ncbi:MAG: hypothetical protein IK144_13220 [Bacteroidaceae bacterium]|nr:hypothetical protein [Bacteroidaceae bacterium]
MRIVRYFIAGLFFLSFLSFSSGALAQEYDYMSQDELEDRILRFRDEYTQLSNICNLQIRISDSNLESSSFTRILREKVQVMNTGLQSLDFRWNAFTQLEQVDIAENEALMEQMTQVQKLRQAVTDSIAAAQQKCNAITDFVAAERFILAQDSIYAVLYKHAKVLSLTKKTAPQLDKVQAQEQAIFEKLQESYDKSKAAVMIVPQLASRAAVIDEHFYSLKAISEKIQAMKYQPLIMRIKDYLMGLACVSIILLFFNMLVTKLQAAKKARQMLKKQKDAFGKTTDADYPTI